MNVFGKFFLAIAASCWLGAQEVPVDPSTALQDRLQQEALAYAEASAPKTEGKLTFRILHPPVLPPLKAGDVRFEPSHLSKQDCAGPFFVAFKVFLNGHPAGLSRVDLEGHWVGKLLRTRTALARKAIPQSDQLEEMPYEGTPPAGALTSFPEGYRLKGPVAAGRILTRSDLQAIPVISSGDPVRVELICGPLSVASDAIARGNGALGEKIRLELPNSKRPLLAVVTGPGMARAEWTAPKS